MQNRNVYTLVLGLLGALKLALASFGIELFSDAQANDIANGVATVVAVAGVVMSHLKRKKDVATESAAPVSKSDATNQTNTNANVNTNANSNNNQSNIPV